MARAEVRMSGDPLTEQTAIGMCAAAGAAPSEHNTQPWRFAARLGAQALDVFADPDRALPVADPRGRAVHIACGAAVLNMRVAAAAQGANTVVRLLPDPASRLLLATVRVTATRRPDGAELRTAVFRRHSSRWPFGSQPVAEPVLAALADAAAIEGVWLRVLDPTTARRLLRLSASAAARQRSDPRYRAEVAAWVGGSRTGASDGIPESAIGPPSSRRRYVNRYLPPGRPRPPDHRMSPLRNESPPLLAVLSTRFDAPADWLRAGQAMQRVLLLATQLGLATCPLSPALEVPDAPFTALYRADSDVPQVIIRLGYGPAGQPTPRRPITDTLRVVLGSGRAAA